jgi:hypothetical protein
MHMGRGQALAFLYGPKALWEGGENGPGPRSGNGVPENSVIGRTELMPNQAELQPSHRPCAGAAGWTGKHPNAGGTVPGQVSAVGVPMARSGGARSVGSPCPCQEVQCRQAGQCGSTARDSRTAACASCAIRPPLLMQRRSLQHDRVETAASRRGAAKVLSPSQCWS